MSGPDNGSDPARSPELANRIRSASPEVGDRKSTTVCRLAGGGRVSRKPNLRGWGVGEMEQLRRLRSGPR